MPRKPAKRKPLKVSKALINQLGKRPDQALADEFGVPVERVRRERMLRGHVGPGGPSGWTARDLALLGTASDAEIAKRVGFTPTSVEHQRKRKGIAPYGSTTDQRRHRWTKRQIGWLGNLTDREIAERIGVTIGAVAWKRRLLGVEPTRESRSRHHWTKREIALLGTMPDTELARRLGMHRHGVALKRRQLDIPNHVTRQNKRRWTPERIAKAGKVPDRELAKEMGISANVVSAYRMRHGISLRARARSTKSKAGRKSWSRAQIERLGKVPDRVLADELGITHQAVAALRRRLGIPAPRRKPTETG